MLLKNAIECAHCGLILESTHRHDYQEHTCFTAGKISQAYDHERKCYVEAYPLIAVDGGLEYLRRVGNLIDMIDRSESS